MSVRRTRALVAHVVHRFETGGLENGVANLVNRLPADRFDHAIVALTEVTGFKHRVTRDGVTFHSLAKAPGRDPDLYRRLYRLFRELRPAIVHTRNIAASVAQWPAALARVPVRIHAEHGWDASDTSRGRHSHHLQRRALRPFVHRFVALSSELRRYLEERVGVAPDRVTQVCNGVDTERFVPAERRLDLTGPIGRQFRDDQFFFIGTVGRLSRVKHQGLLVDAFARACALAPRLAPSLRLVIAGDGPDRADLERQVRASGCGERVWMAGHRDDVPGLLAGLDLFVLPSLAEGMSNTILEAMASGVPVLATRVGGNAELVMHGNTGTLVPSNEVEAMAAAIVDYASHPERVDVHGANAREIAVARFSIDAMVDRYAALYDAELARYARRRLDRVHPQGGLVGTSQS